MISGLATVNDAVAALKKGIYDFITKDFRMNELRKVVSKALETQQLLAENQRLQQALKSAAPAGASWGARRRFPQGHADGGRIAGLKSTVLLSGRAAWVRNWWPRPFTCRAPGGTVPW